MSIVWLERARQDLAHAHDWIAADDQSTAAKVVDRSLTSIDRLDAFPMLGRPGRVEGTRELSVPRTPCIVAYQLHEDDVQILAVIHSARRWPGTFE